MKEYVISNEQRELLKDLMVKYGFLIRHIVSDAEFINAFPGDKFIIDYKTQIKKSAPISYPQLLWIIEKDAELKKFKDDHLELIYSRLQDSAYGMAEGIQFKSHVSANTRLEAIKFMMKLIRPEQFKDNINIHNTMPTMFVCGEENAEQTVAEFLENEKNKC